MGQYYRLVLLNSKKKNYPNKKKVAAYLQSWDFDQGAKLMEFSYIGNHFVEHLESLINKESGIYAGSPVIVAGDYADDEPNTYEGEKVNIYELCEDFGERLTPEWFKTHNIEHKHYRYVINEDKRVFIDTERMKVVYEGEWQGEPYTMQVHPLTILCSDGCNGGDSRGGGDYHHKHRMVGAWRRNVVVVSDNRPDEKEYREVFYNFKD